MILSRRFRLRDRHFPMKSFRFAPIAILVLISAVSAQEAVPVGKGSYASSPPKGKVMDSERNVDLVEETEQRPLYLLKDDGRPIPSNKWFQNLLFQQYATGLWAMPHKVDATPEGLDIYHPTKFADDGSHIISEFPLVLTGKHFRPTDSRAKSWSDCSNSR